MASQLLKLLLTEENARERLKHWLWDLKAGPHQYNLLNKDVPLTQGEFAVYFLNHLRAETLSFLQARKCCCNLQKKIIEKIANEKETEVLNIARIPERQSTIKVIADVELSPYSEKYYEYFPELGTQNKSSGKKMPFSAADKFDKRSRRRIKPTPLSSPSSSSNENGFLGTSERQLESPKSTFTTCEIEDYQPNLDCERQLLKNKKGKKNLYKSHHHNYDPPIPDTAIADDTNSIDENVIKVISEVYCSLIKYGLVASIADEIKFTLRLLLQQPCSCTQKKTNHDSDQSAGEIPNIFQSASHCIKFAVEVIDKQFLLFWCLDHYCLKMLSSNENIKVNSSKLYNKINQYLKNRIDNSGNFIIPINCNTTANTVTFHSDTDIRSKFNTYKSFRLFCKQRDTFYNIYQRYKEHNDQECNANLWDKAKFESDVRALIELCLDPVNFSHLASLFVDQCIQSCMKQELDEKQAVPFFLKNIDHCKWLQLSTRLVAAEDVINKKEEQFFKEFIFSVKNQLFINSLIQALLKKITELTLEANTIFEIDDDVRSSELSMKIFMTHHSLLLLGRLLGICLFGSDQYHGPVQEELINIHSQTLQPVDFVAWLLKAIERGVLVLTIPWIVESLLPVDHVSLHVPQIQATIKSLISIFTTLILKKDEAYDTIVDRLTAFDCEIKYFNIILTKLEACAFGETEVSEIKINDVKFTECTSLLIRLWISKLFKESTNLTVFSETLFYSLITPGVNKSKDVFLVEKRQKLDCVNVINQYVLSKYCPHLYEVKNLFSQSNSTLVSTFRHITPFKVSQLPCNENINIQMQLEDSFFNAHKGLRSTVDFIIDRVASVCKNAVTNDIETKKIKLLNSLSPKNQHSKEEIAEISCAWIKQIETAVQVVIEEYSQTAIPSAIGALLPFENGSAIFGTCKKIAVRKLKQQLMTWMQINISHVEEVLEETAKKITTPIDSPQNNLEEIFNNELAFSHELLQLQEMLECILMKTSPRPKYEEIIHLLLKLFEGTRAEHLSPKMLSEVYISTWDFVISLVTNMPELVTNEILELMCNFWKKHHHGDVEERILCPRNIYMASKNDDNNSVSIVLAKLLAMLFKKELMKLANFEQQALSLLRHNWQQEELKLIRSCISDTKILLKDSIYCDDKKFSLMLEWILETTEEIESEYN